MKMRNLYKYTSQRFAYSWSDYRRGMDWCTHLQTTYWWLLQITTTLSLISTLDKSLHAKFLDPAVFSLVVAWLQLSTLEILHLLCSRRCCPADMPQLVIPLTYSAISSQHPLQNSFIAPTVLVIISRHGPHRKHRSSIVAWVIISAGTCLPSCCPETAIVNLPISQPLHSNCCTRYTSKVTHKTF
jgi:hypothetical protein